MPRSIQPTVDVCDWIDRQRIGRLQKLVLWICGACTLLEGFDAQNIGYVAPVLIDQWDLKGPEFAPVFMAGLIGLLIGFLFVAPLADKFGRRSVLLGSVCVFSLFSFVTSIAWSVPSLSVFRLLTGIGVGGGMANAIALTSEYFPQRKRAAMTVIMFVGFPLGTVLAGILSAWLIPHLGWQSLFLVGGIVPIFVAMAIIIVLPELIPHLVLHHVDSERVASALTRINRRTVFMASTRFVLSEEAKTGFPVAHLFRDGRAAGTVLIWTVFFTSLLDFYLMVTWLPVLLGHDGLPLSLSVAVLGVLQVSGVLACFAITPLLARGGVFAILPPAYLVAAIGIFLLGAVDRIGLLLLASAIAGIGIVSGQNTANALVASFYPTYIRATGIGWALGVGCIGAVAGPALGALLLALHLSRPDLLCVAALPELVAFAAILCLMRLRQAPTARTGQAQVSAPR